MYPPIKTNVLIKAPLQKVWQHLTRPELMADWAGEPELEVEIITDWQPGQPFLIKGFHHVRFENRGQVLQFEPYRIIQYSQLSSVSRLADRIENYSITTFVLTSMQEQTHLALWVENFPTETIYKHLEFYWQGTLGILKSRIENSEKE